MIPTIILIDLFCGAGGLTEGASQVPGVRVVACVNHDAIAIESHRFNHPDVIHFTEDVRNPEVIAHIAAIVQQERRKHPQAKVIIWASLECTNFSKAKGGLPRDADSRTLAECLFAYEAAIKPDGIEIENVEEFMAWGPLDENGKPLSRRNGRDYLNWVQRMQARGFRYEFRILNAADYGAYTSRRRFFGQFMKPHMPMVWPEATHAKEARNDMFVNMEKWKPVKEVLDFSNKGESIFNRKKPLVENTLKRIYAGLVKYVAAGDDSFLKKYYSGKPEGHVISVNGPAGTTTTIDHHALVQSAFLVDYHGNSDAANIDAPSPTIATKDKLALATPAFIYKYHKTGENLVDIEGPASTVTTKDRMASVWIDKQYGNDKNHQSIEQPAGTIMVNDKHCLMQAFIVKNFSQGGQHNSVDGPVGALVTVPKENLVQCVADSWLLNPQYESKGGSVQDPAFTLIARMDKMPPYLMQIKETNQLAILIFPEDSETMQKIKLFMATYGISDIYMRMLTIEELKAIQGFPKTYTLMGTQTQQKKHLGNAVEVNMARHLIGATVNALDNLKQAVA